MDSAKKILVVEDARGDRMRFRHLFTKLELPEDRFEFAWAWPKKGLTGVRAWFFQGCKASEHATLKDVLELCGTGRLAPFSMVLLDLAWSSDAEGLMRGLQGLRVGDGLKLAIADYEGINYEGINEYKRRLQDLLDRVEGITFLERWKKLNNKEKKPAVWVTSAYTPINARELRIFINTRYKEAQIFQKWIDESKLKQEIEYFLRVD
jgi:hypothetical protein